MKVVPLKKPRTFDAREQLIEDVRERIFTSGLTYQQIATRCNVNVGTVNKLANGTTRWPRHTTLFPLLDALNVKLAVVAKNHSW